jgi:hypothetical protein
MVSAILRIQREKKVVVIVFMLMEKEMVLNELKELKPNRGYFSC